ncbi:hypothetical protein DPMN_131793 [Dreissena polymorpha]|uniref:Uncharacterized protein n=1 Tax=Dreissena polymorpha TaxID=45954 RepID=A0A9D4FRA4_DREPO|nr:hypothetical protein DPMN_131793 [Dreissena polymorpha]
MHQDQQPIQAGIHIQVHHMDNMYHSSTGYPMHRQKLIYHWHTEHLMDYTD